MSFIEGVIIMLIIAIIGGSIAAVPYGCNRRWEDSKFEHRYKWGAGCQIKTIDGWISDKNYRVVNN